MGYVKTRLKKDLTIDSIVTIHYFEYPPGFTFLGEEHDFWEFLYVDRGNVEITAGEAKHILHNGSIIFHEPMEFHAIHSIGNKAPNLVAMSFECNDPLMSFFRHGVFKLNTEERLLISKIIHVATECFSTPINVPSIEQVIVKDDCIPGHPQLISTYLEQLLLLLFQRKLYASVRRPTGYMMDDVGFLSSENKMDQIIKYMGDNITEKFVLNDFCKTFQMSRSSLESLFAQEKNCSPKKFFVLMKIDKSKELMREGTLNITEIAHYLSFSSLQHFSTQFTKVTGLSPNEYRASIKSLS